MTTLRRTVLAATTFLLALALAAMAVVLAGSPRERTPAMLRVAPGGAVTFDDIPPAAQVHYRHVAEDPEPFEHVTCWCGCGELLDHRSLHDCFVRPGGGWERHAHGCAVCLAEADQVVQARAAGTDIPTIAAQVDERFGAIMPDTQTAS